MVPTEYKHIVLDDRGRALVDGTTMKVRELILDHLAYGWSARELRWQHPHLTMPQIYAALAYYHEHQDRMDQKIREDLAWVEEQRNKTLDDPLRRIIRERSSTTWP